MGLLDRYRQAPPSVSGRVRHDMVLGLADAALAGLWGLSGAIRRTASPPETDHIIALTVADRQVVAHDQDVIALTLAGENLPRWHPGSHIDIHLPSGLVRQYSLCGNPGMQDAYRIAVGATVTTHGPRNAFPLTVPGYGSPARRFRFIAGGIGITPILPMLDLAQRCGVDWSMVYAGRSRDSLPFVDEVAGFGERVAIRTDDVSGLPAAAELLGDCADGTAVYACGPAPMLTAIRSALAGRDNVELHFERFAAPPVVDGREFTVSVASTGARVRVGSEETLLSALNRAGVRASYSCQQGFCGTCRTKVLGVLGGAVDHRDTLLTDPERDNGMMLICISRAVDGSHLTLDL
jgi:ferredoxin-NADP reductase